jgi:uncharacterized protein YxjI
MSSLAPAPQPIGVFPQFLAAGPETLVLKEKVISLSGDSFSIKLANGTPVLQVEGKVMSLTGRKKMFDMQGNHLCSIVKEHFHLHSTYVVESAKGDKIMEVKSSFKRKSWHLIWTERGKRGRRMIGRVLVMEVDVTDWC